MEGYWQKVDAEWVLARNVAYLTGGPWKKSVKAKSLFSTPLEGTGNINEDQVKRAKEVLKKLNKNVAWQKKEAQP